jgi:hypothetical protein
LHELIYGKTGAQTIAGLQLAKASSKSRHARRAARRSASAAQAE